MPQQNREYVGFWARVAATIVDTVVILVITFPLIVAIYGWAYFDSEQSTGIFAGPMDLLISWVFPAVAVIAFWIYRQATPGKMLISARIVDAETGRNPSTAQCIGRYFAYFVSILPLCLGLLWVAFDERKQGWHDKLAGTVVVKTDRGGWQA